MPRPGCQTPADRATQQNRAADHMRETIRARHTPEAIEAAALREMRHYANQYAYRYQVSPVSIWWTARAIQDHYDAMTAEVQTEKARIAAEQEARSIRFWTVLSDAAGKEAR